MTHGYQSSISYLSIVEASCDEVLPHTVNAWLIDIKNRLFGFSDSVVSNGIHVVERYWNEKQTIKQ